jgi:hypothetical protein
MKDLNQALDLLNQVIEKSEIDDKIEASKPEWDRSLDGDGWITYHLKLVRELLENHKNAENKK